MPRKKKTVKVVSIGNVKCDGTYHPPGKEWDCPHDMVGGLEEVGAVERIRMIERKSPAKPKTERPKPGLGEDVNNPPDEGEGSDQDDATADTEGDPGDQN